MEVWENEKCCGNTSRRRAFSQLFRVLPNFQQQHNNTLFTLVQLKYIYNIARALVLSKSYWAIMNKIFMYAPPCSIKWRVQFRFSCKISVAFSLSSFSLSFGNVKIILNNPNPTSSLWLLLGKDVYFNVSILTLFVSIFIEYFGVCLTIRNKTVVLAPKLLSQCYKRISSCF